MIDIQNVQIDGNITDDILDCLKNILITPAGTVPFDRNFGIDMSIIDEPLNLAEGKLIVEFTRKIQQYEPRVKIKQVIFSLDKNNNLIPKVSVE